MVLTGGFSLGETSSSLVDSLDMLLLVRNFSSALTLVPSSSFKEFSILFWILLQKYVNISGASLIKIIHFYEFGREIPHLLLRNGKQDHIMDIVGQLVEYYIL
jgi:hypothetical protein